MPKETVVDYEVETREVERERIISDFSGDELDPEEVVEWHANPRVDMYRDSVSDGVMYTSPEEAAEFHGIDLDDLEPGQELPKYLAKQEEVEVVERPWLSVGFWGDPMLTILMLAMSVLASWGFLTFLFVSEPVTISGIPAVLVMVGALCSVVVGFGGAFALFVILVEEEYL